MSDKAKCCTWRGATLSTGTGYVHSAGEQLFRKRLGVVVNTKLAMNQQ